MIDEADTFVRKVRTRRRIMVALVLGVPLVVVLYLGVKFYRIYAAERDRDEADRRAATLSDDELADLRARLKPAHDAIAARRAAFLADVTQEKLEQVKPTDVACRSRLLPQDFPEGIPVSMDGVVLVVPTTSSVQPPGGDDQELRRVEAALSHGEREKSDLASVRRIVGQGEDVVIVVGGTTPPSVNPVARDFTPGRITGKAYLYSYAQRRITCFAEVQATNSSDIKISYSSFTGAGELEAASGAAYRKLEQDLQMRLREQLAHQLRATEP